MTPSSDEVDTALATLTDAYDVALTYRRWTPAAPRGIVLLLHGASEHGGRYDRFARDLTAAGWAVYAPDHRGHGATAEATGRGHAGPGGVAAIVEDVELLRQHAARELRPQAPVVVFGHSMGSLLALAYTQRIGRDLAGVVLCGTAGIADGVAELADAIAEVVESGMADEEVDALSPLNASFEPARTPYDWLSRDEHEVDAYIADPDCGEDLGMTYGFLAGILELTAEATSPEGIDAVPRDVPMLLITGERDAASNDASNVRRLEVALRETGHDVTSHYYADARHELLNETNRDEVVADVLAWLERRI